MEMKFSAAMAAMYWGAKLRSKRSGIIYTPLAYQIANNFIRCISEGESRHAVSLYAHDLTLLLKPLSGITEQHIDDIWEHVGLFYVISDNSKETFLRTFDYNTPTPTEDRVSPEVYYMAANKLRELGYDMDNLITSGYAELK